MAETQPRRAAARFAHGAGRYVADLSLPGMVHLAIRRSDVAHATLRRVDLAPAAATRGVLGAFSAGDLTALQPVQGLWNLAGQNQVAWGPLAGDRLCWVGHPVAAVVARDAATARRAAASITVEFDELPPLATIDAALAPEAARLHPHWPDNRVVERSWQTGDAAAGAAQAAATVRGRFVSQRVHPLPLEPRGAVARWEPQGDGLTLWSSTQSPHQLRAALQLALSLPEHRIRVIAPDVGGAFGMKAMLSAEELLTAWAAIRLGRPVRWIERRDEAFCASTAGRDQRVDLALSLAADGRVLALDADIMLDKGAEPGGCSIGTAWITGATLTGPYAIDTVSIRAGGVVTSKTPTGAYRGFGQPEANFAIERALDHGARALSLDPAELRRRNLVPEQALPCPTPTGLFLDSGRYHALLDLVLARFDWTRARRDAEAARAGGLLRGVGLACYSEVTNLGPSALCGPIGIDSGGFDVASIRMEPSGHVRLFTGQTPMGQGVETVLARVAAEALTVPREDVEVVHGDTLACAYTGYASGGSRGAGVGGAAARLAAQRLAKRLCRWGAHLLDRDPDTVRLVQAGVQAVDDPTQRVSLATIASAAYRGATVPPGLELGLEDRAAYDPPGLAVSYGAVAVALDLDRDTGQVQLRHIVFGHDCGPQLDERIVEGQVRGGVVQAIGATLYEQLLYDEHGQPLVRSLQHYPLPLAADVPPIELLHLETPSPFSPGGVKGVGESGTIPVPAAIVNAIEDALSNHPGAPLDTLPVTPDKIFARLNA
jgi:aerobic carbon-monoxide dehydrogenase large subunit